MTVDTEYKLREQYKELGLTAQAIDRYVRAAKERDEEN